MKTCIGCKELYKDCICEKSVLREVGWESTQKVWNQWGKLLFKGHIDKKNKKIVITGLKNE